jgi:NADH/NAD ratio-sensing transcriptional regulator Rex
MYRLEIAAAFDIGKRMIGRRMGRVLIEDMGVLDHLNTRGIDVGIIAVTQAISQKVTEAL